MRDLEMIEIDMVDGAEMCAGPMSTASKVELGVVFVLTGVAGAAIWLVGYSHTC